MLAVPDTLAAAYLTCFLLGLIFVLISALLGATHELIHVGGHDAAGAPAHDAAGAAPHDAGGALGQADAGHAAGTDAGHATDSAGAGGPVTASPLNLMTLMAFLTWFGGAGYILHVVVGAPAIVSLPGAAGAGFLAAWLVYLFLVRVLLPATASDARERRIIGSIARVTIPIQAGGVGEVVYTMAGARHSDGARSADALPIPRGTEVVIVRYERGIAYVQPWEHFVAVEGEGEPAPPPAARGDEAER